MQLEVSYITALPLFLFHIDHHHESATAVFFHVVVFGVMRDVIMKQPLAEPPRWQPSMESGVKRKEGIDSGLYSRV